MKVDYEKLKNFITRSRELQGILSYETKELGKSVEAWVFRYSLANMLNEELEQENIYYLDEIKSIFLKIF